jgi:C4-dicarboxylate transporter DctQ subunit
MLRFLRKLDEQIATVLEVLAAALLASAAGLGAYQVLTRFVLHQPSTWSEALTRTLLIWMVCIGVALAVRVGALVAFDVLRNIAGGRFAKFFQLLGLGFSVFFFGLLTYYGYQITERVRFQNLAGLEISIAWSYAALPVGGVLSTIAAILSFVRVATDKPTAETERAVV